MKPPPAALDVLAAQGGVSALIAPNAFHHLGQAAWRARFPDAISYAPAGALPRLRKKAPEVPFQPVDELTRKLPPNVAVLQPEGMKAPDLFVRATSGGRTVWFTGDLVSNTTAADIGLPARLIFGLLGGGSGFRFNRVPAIVYVKDRKAWFDSVRAAFEQAPPSVVMPGHGDPVRDDAAARSRAILA
jgi:glyoxylase-like metal-dependent hydrolase (beta-lactamase superfamily II)